MGISFDIMQIIDRGRGFSGTQYDGMKMCELGCQEMRRRTYPKGHSAHEYRSAKQYFESLGVEHISIDLQGCMGSLKLDLSKPIDEWQGYFDMLTNSGTTEHVKKDQWTPFKNIHNLVRPGGAMVHGLPLYGREFRGHNHRDCVFYLPNFYDKLARANGYSLFYKKVLKRGNPKGGIICAVMIKGDKEFVSEKEFDEVISPSIMYYK